MVPRGRLDRSDFDAFRSDVQDVRRHVATLDERISARIETLDVKMSGQFPWIVGIQVAMLIVVIGALLRALRRLVPTSSPAPGVPSSCRVSFILPVIAAIVTHREAMGVWTS
jgi:hypothetical protein